MNHRSVSKITQSPFQPGFLGAGHIASAVFEGLPFDYTDPFIIFQDDQVDYQGGPPAGGAHPHAGFETLTLVLEGNGSTWETGSFELMTAGKGIVHTEEMNEKQKLRILQVWLALPPGKRWAQPFWQKITLDNVPTVKNEFYEVRVYSGSSNGLNSPMRNLTPLTVVDFRLKENQKIKQHLPADQKGLIYVLEGSVYVGDQMIRKGQTGWLNKSDGSGIGELTFESRDESTRFILYAAGPHNAPIVSHGPFIGDTVEDISRLYKEYRNGEMPHLNDLPEDQKLEFK